MFKKSQMLLKLFTKIKVFLINYINFRKSHISHTDNNMLETLIRRTHKALLVLCDLVVLPLAIFIVFIIRALSPFILIRFQPLSHRIGHFSANIELYLCRREIENAKIQRTIDVFYCKPPISNRYLKKMWGRVFHICYLAHYLDRVNRNLPGGKKHTFTTDIYGAGYNFYGIDNKGLLQLTRPHLSFTPKEERRGYASLRDMGIPEKAPFICFFMRDSNYLKHFFKTSFYYHNFRDCNIQNCRLAVEEMANQGYYMLRMGAVVKEPFTSYHPKIIDYATKYRTEFLDIFLSAKCRFFITSFSGISGLPMIFRRPIAWVNCIPYYVKSENHTYCCFSTSGVNNVFIPKKLWLKKKRRLMTFREILNSGAGGFTDTRQFDHNGIEVIENTPEEIKALIIEMNERLNNKWQCTQEDKELQARFWSLFDPAQVNSNAFTRIGSAFLKQNRELLA